MIKSVTVTNHLGESIQLELAFPEKSGFAVRSIEGLGPTKADINMTELANTDGSSFNSARTTSRNVIIQLKFLENPTIEDSRQASYRYFPTKKEISLLVETDNRICEIYGHVEANDPVIFDKNSGSQISIICPYPYFHSIDKNVSVFSGIESLLEFELSDDLFELGEIKKNELQSIYYYGDTEVGVNITIHALGPATNVTIYNIGTRETMKIDTNRLVQLIGSGITSGDDIIISTVKGDKYVTLLRGGTTINIINCLDRNTDWFLLNRGENIFAYSADTGVEKLEFRIENQVLYKGV